MKLEKKYLEIPFDCINGLIVEPGIKFTKDGMFIKSFTECNSSMAIFSLPKEKFIEYEFEGEEEFKVQIDLLNKVMKRIKTKIVNIGFKEQKIIISDEKGKEYSIAVLHDETVKRDEPQLETTGEFNIESAKLQNLFLDAEIVGTEISLNYENKKLNINSGELNKFKEEIECDGNGQAKSKYGLEYLNKFMTASKYFESVDFKFSSDGPCILIFKNDDSEIKFILAARASEE